MTRKLMMALTPVILPVLASCLSTQDVGSQQTLNPGCEAGTRFGEDDIECGNSEADINLSVGTPAGQALLREEATSIGRTRFGETRIIEVVIKNLGQTLATDLRTQLNNEGANDQTLTLVEENAEDLPQLLHRRCSTTLEPGMECAIPLRFAPNGSPFTSQTWTASLRIEYQNGREQRLLEFPLEATGEDCAERQAIAHFETPEIRHYGRIESDSLQITQSLELSPGSGSAEPSEIATLQIPLRLSSLKTRVEHLRISLHLEDPEVPGLPLFPAIAETSLAGENLYPGRGRSQVSMLPSTDEESSTAIPFQWLRFTFEKPVQVASGSRLVWALQTEGLKSGSLLYGRHEDLNSARSGYLGGIAGTYSEVSHSFTALPFLDTHFILESCANQPTSL